MSQRLTLTALRSALLRGEPCNNTSRVLQAAAVTVQNTNIEHRDLGKVLKGFPFSPDVVHTAHNDDVFQLVVVEVGGSQRHHEVAEPDERTVGVSEQADNHVAIEDSHGRLVTILDNVVLSALKRY